MLSRSTLTTMMLVMLVLAPLARAASPEASTGFLFKTFKQGEASYNYTVYVPRNYDSSKKYPLIMFLHGAGECGTDGTKQVAQGIGTAILWNAEKWPFIVVMPQKPVLRDPWEKYDDVVMGMLDRAKKDYNVDTTRLYLTGLSQGGHGTWAIGTKHPSLWAAIAPICGYGNPEDYASALKDMPIWCFHGEADKSVSVEQSRAIVEAIKTAGGSPKLTTYPGVEHNSWDKAYREEKLYDWFLEHKREK
jgi:predicted peptidase